MADKCVGSWKRWAVITILSGVTALGVWTWSRQRARQIRIAERQRICEQYGIETDGLRPFVALPRTLLHRSVAAELGRSLYTDARLVRLPYRTCAACHRLNQGGIDGRCHEGVFTRPVYNAVLGSVFFHDGRETALTNAVRTMIEHGTYGAGGPLAARVAALQKDASLVRRFQFAYDEGLTEATVVDALTSYLSTLLTSGMPLDLWCVGRTDALTEEQKLGMSVFERRRCADCHDGPALGARKTAQGRKVAALRGLSLRKSYLPDGREPDLGVVLMRMPGGSLEAEERAALVAFLKAL